MFHICLVWLAPGSGNLSRPWPLLYSLLASFLGRLFPHEVASVSTSSSTLHASYLLRPQWERFFFPESPSKSSGANAKLPCLGPMQISEPGPGCGQERRCWCCALIGQR